MGVQDRQYLAERPMHEVQPGPHPSDATLSRDVADKIHRIEQLDKEAAEAKRMISQLTAKIEDMHKAALTRPEVKEMVVTIEQSLVSLCSLRVSDERSRQILSGVQVLLQTSRLNQGAASELPAARIGWEAALSAYYDSCSQRELEAVERFDGTD